MNRYELVELIRILKENKDIIFDKDKFINKDTYMILKCIVSGRIADEYDLTREQQELIMKIFINLNRGFNKRTPSFILENTECIRSAILNDINSVKYVREENLDDELKNYIIEELLRQKFVITKECPDFLCNNFQLVKNSIILNVKSADYIDWLMFSDEECNELINILIEKKYILHSKSHMYLKNNVDIILNSIEDNIKNIEYATEYAKEEPKIFKYLLLNGYEFSKDEILDKEICFFKDPEMLREALKIVKVYTNNDKKYCERLFEIFRDVINSEIKIKDFDEVFKYNSEELWDIEKRENAGIYNNVFAKICAGLRNSIDFDEVFYELDFLEQMKVVLKNQFQELLLAMEEYHKIYHGNMSDKLNKLENSKNTISKLSALFVSKSKDNFINDGIEVMREYLYPYFNLNLREPEIYKKLVLSKKMKIFRKEYLDKKSTVWKSIQEIVDVYRDTSDYLLVKELVDYFIIHNSRNVSQVVPMPRDYKKYCRYKDALKLVNRLNNGYIKYNDMEVIGYHDIIRYDSDEKKYIYCGGTFKTCAFVEYERKMKLYNLLKKQIMLKVKDVKLDEEFDADLISILSDEFDFNDRYFEYSKDKTLSYISLRELVNLLEFNKINSRVLVNDEQYKIIYDILVNKRIIWCFLMGETMFYRGEENLSLNSEKIVKIINKIDLLMNLAQRYNFDLSKFKDLWTVYEISDYASERDLAILGNDIVNKLTKNLGFTSERIDEIILIARDLVCQMIARNKSTVPYVNGKYLNYCYSLYDSQDNSILTAGIDTDACFRVDGTDNDFLHYCALNKNGFVIKITDEFGNFVARAAGFRNGNCVYVNQLRTIYDQNGNDYLNDYDSETEDIIKTFELACRDIVNTSQNNSLETNKIEHVFVTKSYCLDSHESNISDDVSYEIGGEPEENDSEDWNLFVKNTPNLRMQFTSSGLGTDYGGYSVICMASVKEPANIEPDDIQRGEVPAVYERKRSKIKVLSKSDEETKRKMNKLKAIIMTKDYQPVELLDDSLVITGDNWYIIVQDGKIIDCCILAKDKQALVEARVVIKLVEELYSDKMAMPEKDIENKIELHLKKILN